MTRANIHATQAGLSIVELMVAMALGLLLMTSVGSLFVNTSRSNSEVQKAAQQIENGRYATGTLSDDLKLAGFYGQFSALPPVPAAADPCETASATNLFNAMAVPVQVFRPASLTSYPDLSTTTCAATLLTNANLAPGSDVVVVRRASTAALAPTATALSGEVYVQANPDAAQIQFGNGGVPGISGTADGSALTIRNRIGNAAEIRKYEVHVYFIAPCSSGTAANGVCQASDDTIPTLKRLELKVDPATGIRGMVVSPIANGIQYLKAEWGIDNSPSTVNVDTGLIGDGTLDVYEATPALADLTNALTARIFLLARNTETTTGYVDTKTYTLGTVAGTTTAATNDAYKRHVFVSEVKLTNIAGRKEIPQ